MSTSHPPNGYTSSYHHQLASQPHHQPPQSQYQHQPYPPSNHHLPGPVQIVRSGSKDSASSGHPSPNRDGRDGYPNRERREGWDARVERKTRPATIAELADKSREALWDPNKSLKHWLRTAELARKAGKQYAEDGDYERSFVQLARAASIILEKMQTHKDYNLLLSTGQRNNLVLHGQETLDNLSKLKPGLVERYDKWAAKYPEYVDDPSLKPPVLLESAILALPGPQSSSRDPGDGLRDSRHNSYTQEELVNMGPPRRDSDRERDRNRDRDREREREREHSREPPRDHYSQPARDSPSRSHEEARKAAEEAIKRRTDQIRSSGRIYSSSSQYSLEHAGIAQRQQEAEAAAQAVRREIASSSHVPPNLNMNGPPPVMPVLPAPVSASSQQNLVYPPPPTQSQPPPQPPPPMQIPQSYQNTAVTSSSGSMMNLGSIPQPQKPSTAPYNAYTSSSSASMGVNPPLRRGSNEADAQKQEDDDIVIPPPPASFPAPIRYSTQHAVSHDPALSTKLTNRYPYPSPVTTTSPPPGPINYPTLMSQHQMKQGYVPSLHSMFQPPPQESASSSLLFQDGSGSSGYGGANGLYNNLLPQQSMPIGAYDQQGPRRPSPIPPPPPPAPAPPPPSTSVVDQTRITPASSADAVTRELKTVYLPRESLPRFLNVAAVNTARNRETCGLLLGKDKRSRFVVTTLLIPKQHSTSDTCTMDEEELVMSFTEERSLITLGWIHTHPTQSCFMSSVDLHTHSGFQRMLPESFAVVCAPTSTPNFGIFRLTEPPGLQTILDCTQKEAFHPHPPVPIYTDADKGHVQIKDSLSLEIVDLRDE